MNESDVQEALRAVWRRHRETVLDDLAELIVLMRRGDSDSAIAALAHRILGSLSMVGLSDVEGTLRHLERSTGDFSGSRRDEEVVERLHDLLVRLRSTD